MKRKRMPLFDSTQAREDHSTQEMEKRRVLTAGRRVMRLDLPPEIARKLDDAGFKYGSDLQCATPRDIMTLCNIGPWTVNLIFEEVGRKENNSFLLDEYREVVKKLHQNEDGRINRSRVIRRIRQPQAK